MLTGFKGAMFNAGISSYASRRSHLSLHVSLNFRLRQTLGLACVGAVEDVERLGRQAAPQVRHTLAELTGPGTTSGFAGGVVPTANIENRDDMTKPIAPITLALCSSLTLFACADFDDNFDDSTFRVDLSSEQVEQHQSPVTNDLYGHAVAIYGSHALAGAPFHSLPGASNTGTVETWEYDAGAWNYTGELSYQDPLDNQVFGSSVAVYGNWAIVGVPGFWSNRGRAVVYQYVNGSWQQQHIFSPTGNGSIDDMFGASVSISGTVAVVGVPGHDGAETNSGQVYVYRRSGSMWTEIQKVTPSSPMDAGNFGSDVDIEANGYRMVVAADNSIAQGQNGPVPGSYDGSAEVFVRTGANSTYLSEDELAGPGVGWGFANSVAISGDVLVGQPGGTQPGAAKVYVRSASTWSLDATLSATTPAAGDSFGNQVAFGSNGDHAFISAPLLGGVGRLFEFRDGVNGWYLDDDFGSANTLHFGSDVAASTTQLIVGDVFFDNAQGRIHLYKTDEFDPDPGPTRK